MKAVKRIVCSFLALVMVVGLTSCSQRTFEHMKMVRFCQKHDFSECKKPKDFFEFFTRAMGGDNDDDGAYINCTGRHAQSIYDNHLKIMFNDMPDYDVEEVTAFAYKEDDTLFYGYLFTFEKEKDAGKIFKNYGKRFDDDCSEKDSGKGYEYWITTYDNYADIPVYVGIYLRENTLIMFHCVSEDSAMADEFCKAYGIKSPSEI